MAHTADMMKELEVTTTTANAADFGCPAPSSFPILTLHNYLFINQFSNNCQLKQLRTVISASGNVLCFVKFTDLAAALNPTAIMKTHPVMVMLHQLITHHKLKDNNFYQILDSETCMSNIFSCDCDVKNTKKTIIYIYEYKRHS